MIINDTYHIFERVPTYFSNSIFSHCTVLYSSTRITEEYRLLGLEIGLPEATGLKLKRFLLSRPTAGGVTRSTMLCLLSTISLTSPSLVTTILFQVGCFHRRAYSSTSYTTVPLWLQIGQVALSDL